MTLRTIKLLLVFGVAIFYSLVVFNNITDYGSNYEFVRHVMMMDSTFPGNRGMWRAINTPKLHTAFYLSIIAWETITMLLCWWGGIRMARALRNGTVWINDHNKLFAEAETGGYRQSGLGRLHGYDALADFTEIKHICMPAGVAEGIAPLR